MHSCPSLTRKDGMILKTTSFLDPSGLEFMPCCTSVVKGKLHLISALFQPQPKFIMMGKFSFDGGPFGVHQNWVCLDSEFSKSILASYLFKKHFSEQCISSVSLSI